MLNGTEEVGVEDVFSAGARLCKLEDDGETSVLVVLLVSVAYKSMGGQFYLNTVQYYHQ